jgi:hypothetical protein
MSDQTGAVMVTTTSDLLSEVSTASKDRERLLRAVLNEWHTFMTSTNEPMRKKEAELRLHNFMTQLDAAQGRYLVARLNLDDFDADAQRT